MMVTSDREVHDKENNYYKRYCASRL